jgi:hypothetical protein
VLLAVLLGVLLRRWTVEMYGPGAGVAAVALYAVSPSFLAHGHLATADVAAALGYSSSLFAWWLYLRDQSTVRAFVAGIATGVAILLKFSCAIALGVIVLSGIVDVVFGEGKKARRFASLTAGVIALLAALVMTIDLGYGLQRINGRLGDLVLPSRGPVARLAVAYPQVIVPLPQKFLEGLDLVATGRDSVRTPFYLAGEFSEQGWWYYHLVAFALKTPLPILLASVAAILLGVLGRLHGKRASLLALGAMAVFAANAAANPLATGVRHLLPAEPLLLILVAPWVAGPLTAVRRTAPQPGAWLLATAAVGAFFWVAYGTARVAPRYLEYFNEAAGGPANGREWLLDSNLDWGQDLVRLSRYMKQRGLRSIPLAYMGTVHPAVYGVRFTALSPQSRGIVAISPSTLMGSTYAIWSDERRHESPTSEAFAWLRVKQPVEQVGALLVFDLH